ncbi:hypothetical protein V2A60_004800 [Cordyceps javanica]|uniref:Uncharacterized protein n=1 Tax=Cordyceps javanica TaxID=43265 RepID=A0A545VC68_9HYPO|nr:hypothetical protein IF1G_01542 [Cordyceps javanica]TQW10995.1 hypothetical protein IF2G_01937 [Cordyceps javanica]
MPRALHIVLVLVAALGFCLTAQQLHHFNSGMAAARGRRGPDRQAPPAQQHTAAPGFVVEVERPTGVRDTRPPPAPAAAVHVSSGGGGGDVISDRDSLTDDSQPRPTRVKTPAAETVLPTNTKVPVVVSSAAAAAGAGPAAATSPSDPGFLALVASLGLMTLGMALV